MKITKKNKKDRRKKEDERETINVPNPTTGQQSINQIKKGRRRTCR